MRQWQYYLCTLTTSVYLLFYVCVLTAYVRMYGNIFYMYVCLYAYKIMCVFRCGCMYICAAISHARLYACTYVRMYFSTGGLCPSGRICIYRYCVCAMTVRVCTCVRNIAILCVSLRTYVHNVDVRPCTYVTCSKIHPGWVRLPMYGNDNVCT
jgi:hypothetical protein